MFADPPDPPYVAVIFTSRRTDHEDGEYSIATRRMEQLAATQPGYLGIESVRDSETRLGITVSYWATEDAARSWKQVAEHVDAQRAGAARWYQAYEVRIARVTRAYGSEARQEDRRR